jgi:hypothetical protein
MWCICPTLQIPAASLIVFSIPHVGKLEEAEALYHKKLEALTRALGLGHWRTTTLVGEHAEWLKKHGKPLASAL